MGQASGILHRGLPDGAIEHELYLSIYETRS